MSNRTIDSTAKPSIMKEIIMIVIASVVVDIFVTLVSAGTYDVEAVPKNGTNNLICIFFMAVSFDEM